MAALAKGYQMYRYYQKTFTQIPVMIVDESDIAYSFNNKKNGVYFFWDTDENAYSREAAEEAETASTFSIGYLAIAAAIGLVIGIGGTSLFTWLRKRKKAQKA